MVSDVPPGDIALTRISGAMVVAHHCVNCISPSQQTTTAFLKVGVAGPWGWKDRLQRGITAFLRPYHATRSTDFAREYLELTFADRDTVV
jgi:hypothetical protein